MGQENVGQINRNQEMDHVIEEDWQNKKKN